MLESPDYFRLLTGCGPQADPRLTGRCLFDMLRSSIGQGLYANRPIETARVRDAAWRRGCVAGRGTRAEAGDALELYESVQIEMSSSAHPIAIPVAPAPAAIVGARTIVIGGSRPVIGIWIRP